MSAQDRYYGQNPIACAKNGFANPTEKPWRQKHPKRKINEALVLFSYFYGTKFLKYLLHRTSQCGSVFDVTVQGGSGREVPK
ncbi:MAG: hypothetical protein MUF67_09415 [Desulfobacterales bacterium]|jgi:hypothetical protein|nr:hypothetical protein [Desulfobacterales bacterium]